MRPFDLLLRKLWSETLRGHQRTPGKFGPPQRCLSHGFKNGRQVKAGISSCGDAGLFQRLLRSAGAQQKPTQATPPSDPMQPSPFAYVSKFNRARAMRDFAGFAHRFHKTPELVA